MLQDIIRFNLFGHEFAIHSFGLMLVIGFLSAMYLAKFLARRSGLDAEVFANACLIGLFSGVIGARLSHVLENFSDFTRADRSTLQNLKEVANIASGGLTYYGGFLLAFATLVIYALWKKIPLRTGMDIVAPCILVGLAFGRVGCFMNGCCYGAECDVPWAVQFPYGSYAYEDEFRKGEVNPPAALQAKAEDGTPALYPPAEIKKSGNESLRELASQEKSRALHPAQLYTTITAFLLAAMLVAYFSVPHTPGMVFAMMMIFEGAARFVQELLRVEPPVMHMSGYGLSLSMVLGIGLSLLGVIFAAIFQKMGGSSHLNDRSESVANLAMA